MKRTTLIVVLGILFELASVGIGTATAQGRKNGQQMVPGQTKTTQGGASSMHGCCPLCGCLSEKKSRGVYATTVGYVTHFYPLWFTYEQQRLGNLNQLIGPVRISPIYQTVVAINDDTLYASTFVDVTNEPLVVTIPATSANYSILTLDAYGDIVPTSLVAGQPGTYALTGPDWEGALPSEVTPVSVPVNFFTLIFRTDKFAPDGTNLIDEARTFRKSLKSQPLTSYEADPTEGSTRILPEVFFAVPFKTVADELATKTPIVFLRQLQEAVASPHTPPMTASEQELSDRFNALFGSGEPTGRDRAAFAHATQAAHTLIIDRYLQHTDAANWISFTNIGAWGDQVIDRSAIAEFIQFGNGHSTAAYYHTFKDSKGRALDGSHQDGYVLTFRADQIPDAKRFWSVTAYTPESIELISNFANKYEVASYTPGLVKNADGSISIYIAQEPPPGVPEANWLPVSSGPFNVMLRVYGPEGSVAAGTYVPPAVVRINGQSR